MNERERQILIVNGAGLLIGSILVGWVFFFFLLKAAVLWPIPGSVPLDVPGDERGWRMAHMEGLTQGLLLIGIGAIGGQLRLSRRQARVLMWSSIVTGWLFFLPAAFGPMAGVRGLAFGGGPFGGNVTLNNLMYVFGWPPMIAVHLMLPLLFWGAWQRLRELGPSGARRVGMIVGATLLALVAAAPTHAAQEASLERTQHLVEQFNARFVRIGPALAENLDQLYTEDVRFRDPISAATGLGELRSYFERFAAASAGSHFEIGDTIVQPGQAAIFWTMVLAKADGTEARRFQGVSHLKVHDRIYEERDYFDLGDAVYDHVPVVGWLTRFVRSRLD